MAIIKELVELKKLLQNPLRSKQQINSLFTSDVEILKLSQNSYLSITTDSISDEISWGLYKDPQTWGWMAVQASVSDLAASATAPKGILISALWTSQTSDKIKMLCQKGINQALRKSQIPLLGGDLGSSFDNSVTSTAFGFSKNKPLTRIGAKPGDILCLVGTLKTGLGPALGFGVLFKSKYKLSEKYYRPEPKPYWVEKIKKYCHASIDTSDGIATSLLILQKLNNVGFELSHSKEIFHPRALQYCKQNKISPLMLYMGDHGDYQTLVCIPKEKVIFAKKLLGKQLVILGKITKKKKIILSYKEKIIQLQEPIHQLQSAERNFKSYKKTMTHLKSYFSNIM